MWGLNNGVTKYVKDSNRSDLAKDYGALSSMVNNVYDYLLTETYKDHKQLVGVEETSKIVVDSFQLAINN